MVTEGYDMVGDIRGHADPLYRLLNILGYVEIHGVFRHPSRHMIFIDRAVESLTILGLVAGATCTASLS
jgi:hypothetical protein